MQDKSCRRGPATYGGVKLPRISAENVSLPIDAGHVTFDKLAM